MPWRPGTAGQHGVNSSGLQRQPSEWAAFGSSLTSSEAWRRADPDAVLAYFADDAVVNRYGSGTTLTGKAMIASEWVVPTLKRFPGAIHDIRDSVETPERIWIEWLYKVPHTTTSDQIALPGCSLYSVRGNLIRRGHLYFNPALARTPPKH